MPHEQEIESIVSQVQPWSEEDRMVLAYRILRETRRQSRAPAPRNTASRAIGIARGNGNPPDDATVRKWIEEHRLKKYG
jgi:hypothetical protein